MNMNRDRSRSRSRSLGGKGEGKDDKGKGKGTDDKGKGDDKGKSKGKGVRVYHIPVDDGHPFDNCDELRERLYGRAACFPVVDCYCCGVHLIRSILRHDRAVDLTCQVCGHSVIFETDTMVTSLRRP